MIHDTYIFIKYETGAIIVIIIIIINNIIIIIIIIIIPIYIYITQQYDNKQTMKQDQIDS